MESFLHKDLCNEIINFTSTINSGFKRHVNKSPEHWDISCDTCRIPIDHNLNHKLVDAINPIWKTVSFYYKFNTTSFEEFEIKKYSESDYVTEHVDQFYGTIKGKERKLTMLLQLNQDYIGGDLIVAKQKIPKTLGTVVVLPAFYLHEVKPITSGTRWSLNCWAWGPYWE